MASRRPNPRGAGKPPIGTILDWSHPLAGGLVAAWNFAAGGGLRDPEACGCGADVTLGSGASPVLWSAFGSLTGIKQPIAATISTAPDMPAFNLAQLSAFALVTFNSLNGTTNNHVFNRTAAVAGFRLFLNPNGPNLKAYVSDGTTTVTATSTPSNIATKTLYHFGMTYDGATVRLYINGQLNATASGSVVPTVTGVTPAFMNLGSAAASTAATDGWLHQAILYNRPLPADEVALLAANPFDMFLSERQSGSSLPAARHPVLILPPRPLPYPLL